VDALRGEWHVIAPDWRGYGLTEWSGQDTYWPPDLVADLDELLDHYEPDLPAVLVGHSMGANTAATYAGVIPGRIRKFVNIEGLGGAPALPEEAPSRYARWLRQRGRPDLQRPYGSFEEFAERMSSENPHLTPERALFLARHWGREDPEGGIVRRADPAQSVIRPLLWRVDEAKAIWSRIEAPMLWVEGAESRSINAMRGQPEGYEDRLMAFKTLGDIACIEGAGHNVHHDQPEKLAQAIERFLAA
jgi:pimeloyl-ACP methyl ester carboxylesterase